MLGLYDDLSEGGCLVCMIGVRDWRTLLSCTCARISSLALSLGLRDLCSVKHSVSVLGLANFISSLSTFLIFAFSTSLKSKILVVMLAT